LEWQGGQLQQLERELLDAAAVQESLTEAQEGVERTAASLLEEGRRLSHSISGVRLDELQQQAAYWTTRVAVAEQAISGTNHRLEERRIEMGRLEDRLTQLEKRLDEARTASSDLDAGKAELSTQVTDLQSQVDQARAQIEPAERELELAETEEASLQEKETAAQKMLANIERSFGQVQLDMTRRQEGLTNLRQRIVDDFGLVLFDYAADVSGPVPLPLEGMVEQLPVVNELPAGMEEQLAQQRAQLRRMGPINPEAKAEFDSESQRYEFMKAQVDDLRKAEADLKQVIAELDELTRREFSRTFDEVDKRFRETFVRLFGGGSARLALTDPENLVETGIEIEARLPGRREQGLALLSGGERSLTAIALVFALLKVSPTPICVMDEVDAMLDEANVGRFRDLLSELSEETQFVIITHNRNTVQAADVIYGITMGRDSASQVISLRLDQVTDEMLSRA
jgi:chromosome segregation protein